MWFTLNLLILRGPKNFGGGGATVYLIRLCNHLVWLSVSPQLSRPVAFSRGPTLTRRNLTKSLPINNSKGSSRHGARVVVNRRHIMLLCFSTIFLSAFVVCFVLLVPTTSTISVARITQVYTEWLWKHCLLLSTYIGKTTSIYLCNLPSGLRLSYSSWGLPS
jgi:hypothetical protein